MIKYYKFTQKGHEGQDEVFVDVVENNKLMHFFIIDPETGAATKMLATQAAEDMSQNYSMYTNVDTHDTTIVEELTKKEAFLLIL